MSSQRISSLRLTNFRCFDRSELQFNENVNIITGLNGTGKTSIIDAVYCLAFGRSYFVSKDGYLVKEGSEFSRLEGQFLLSNQSTQIVCKLVPGRSKVLEVDGVKRKNLTEHIGQIPIICIAPSDIYLVKESSVVRRTLIDKLLSQIDKEYIISLTSYNRLLKQRNAYLKKTPNPIEDMLITFDNQMEPYAMKIYDARKSIINRIDKPFLDIHQMIVDKYEQCDFEYVSQLHEQQWEDGIKYNRKKDLITRRSNYGTHKDDINFKINGRELKYIGSQGQIKSFVFALKMVIYQTLREHSQKEPMVLLDDIFDKLDDHRVSQIFSFIGQRMQSQIMITDTSAERLSLILDNLNFSYQSIPLT